MREDIKRYLSQRTPREIFLAKTCFVLLCLFIAWELGLDDASKRYLQPTHIQESPVALPYLSYFDAQELITKYSTLISFSQSDTVLEHYTLKTQGKINDENFFKLLNIIKTYPTIKINDFSLERNGNFSLTLYAENSQTYALPSTIIPHTAPLSSPWNQEAPTSSPLILQALLNEKARINDRWLKLGEKISGYTLQKIEKSGVVLQNNSHTLTLQLREKIF